MKKTNGGGVPAQPPPPPSISFQEARQLLLAMRQVINTSVERPDPAKISQSKDLVFAAVDTLSAFVGQAERDRKQVADLMVENRGLRTATQSPADLQVRRELNAAKTEMQRLQTQIVRLEAERDKSAQQRDENAKRVSRLQTMVDEMCDRHHECSERLDATESRLRARERTLKLAARLFRDLNAEAAAISPAEDRTTAGAG